MEKGCKGAASHLPAINVFVGFCCVPCRGCRTCRMCCPLEEAVGCRMDHKNVCAHQAWQHHQQVAALQGCSMAGSMAVATPHNGRCGANLRRASHGTSSCRLRGFVDHGVVCRGRGMLVALSRREAQCTRNGHSKATLTNQDRKPSSWTIRLTNVHGVRTANNTAASPTIGVDDDDCMKIAILVRGLALRCQKQRNMSLAVKHPGEGRMSIYECFGRSKETAAVCQPSGTTVCTIVSTSSRISERVHVIPSHHCMHGRFSSLDLGFQHIAHASILRHEELPIHCRPRLRMEDVKLLRIQR
jgi:hypothetical protein